MKHYLKLLFVLLIWPIYSIGQSCHPTWDRAKSSNIVCSPIHFLANSTGKTAFDWDFGAGFSGPSAFYRDPMHVWNKSGLKIVKYRFYGANGNCIDTIMIYIRENPKVFYHQLFSKNQNFEGNKFCFVVDSVKTLDSAQICDSKFIFSDGKSYPILNLKGGDTICHSFSDPAGGYFNLKIESQICNTCFSITEIDSIIQVFPKLGKVNIPLAKTGVSAFPNPTKGVLIVDFVKSSQIFLYSLDGSMLFSENYTPVKIYLDLSKYENENYVLIVFDGLNYSRQLIQKQ